MRNEENGIQEQIVTFLRYSGVMVFSIPNGANMPNVRTRAIFHRTGLLAGAADLVMLLPGGETVFVEVKTSKGRQQESQKQFQERVEKLGFTYLLWRNLADALDFVKGLKGLKREEV